MGIASGTYHAPASALIAEVFPFARRGVALGTHTTAGHLAFFASPLVAGGMLFSGTLPTLHEIAPADEFEMELVDPMLGRRIRHRYRIDVLPANA